MMMGEYEASIYLYIQQNPYEINYINRYACVSVCKMDLAIHMRKQKRAETNEKDYLMCVCERMDINLQVDKMQCAQSMRIRTFDPCEFC